MKAQGLVHKYGSNVDTDVIIPARYLNTADHKELAAHCMEDIDQEFIHKVKQGDLIVADHNLGCGSSRFARIFYRNAINIGLPILECPEASDGIRNGDEVCVDFDTGVITNVTTGETYQAESFPPFIQNIIAKGGLLNSIAQK